MFCLVVDFDYVFNIRHKFLPVEQALNPINKVVGYPMNIFVTIVPGCTWCLVSWYLHMQSPALCYTTAFSINLHSTFQQNHYSLFISVLENILLLFVDNFPSYFFHSLLGKKNLTLFWNYFYLNFTPNFLYFSLICKICSQLYKISC